MKTFYIERSKKKNVLKKIVNKVENKGDKIIIYNKISKSNFSKKKKIARKIMKILSDEKCRQIAIERDLKNEKEFVNLLNSYNINICNNKWLLKNMIDNVIQVELKKQQKEKGQSGIWICINDIDLINENFLYNFAEEFKTLNIITNHIGKFRKFSEKLYKDKGILVNITNNKRKSLLKAELIINYDFPQELLNQFAIYDKAIIINLDEDVKIRKKRFCGTIINNVNFEFDPSNKVFEIIKKEKLENFDFEDICQSLEIIPNLHIF